KEDEELRAQEQQIRRGGNSANTLNILSQFNHHCYWCGTLAGNKSADLVIDDFSKNNINYSLSKVIPTGNQPTSYITVNKLNGSRTIVHYRDLPELDYAHFKTIPLSQFDWLHFEARNIENTAAMVRLCKKNHPQISLSIEIEKPRDGLEEIFNLADIYLFSKTYANTSGFDKPQTFLKSQKIHSPHADLVCAWGEQGAVALLKNGDLLSSESFPPTNLIDTLGAGDTFNAALIHSRLKALSWQDSLIFACKLAGKKCGQAGFSHLG
ncbi:MAG TPA: ketohexokinase, partial [Gammaproteobacteria bacterium]|nr:ketohexokinase [Gammaproteobacteria bacterium]